MRQSCVADNWCNEKLHVVLILKVDKKWHKIANTMFFMKIVMSQNCKRIFSWKSPCRKIVNLPPKTSRFAYENRKNPPTPPCNVVENKKCCEQFWQHATIFFSEAPPNLSARAKFKGGWGGAYKILRISYAKLERSIRMKNWKTPFFRRATLSKFDFWKSQLSNFRTCSNYRVSVCSQKFGKVNLRLPVAPLALLKTHV